MPQKGSSPWSTRTVAEGGTDSPVSDLVPVPDSAQPVINAGFIDESGKWRLAAAADDSNFTFQDPSQALAAGADLEFFVNMLKHDLLILAVLDASSNSINVDLLGHNPTTLEGPYNAKPFQDTAVNGSQEWNLNKEANSGNLKNIFKDTNVDLTDTWKFFKIKDLRGTQLRLVIHNNEGADAGTISTAYLRLV